MKNGWMRWANIASIAGRSIAFGRGRSRPRGASESVDLEVAALLRVSALAGLAQKLRLGLPDLGPQDLQLPELFGEVVLRCYCLASIVF